MKSCTKARHVIPTWSPNRDKGDLAHKIYT